MTDNDSRNDDHDGSAASLRTTTKDQRTQKDNSNSSIIDWSYIGSIILILGLHRIMENKMETTIVYWDNSANSPKQVAEATAPVANGRTRRRPQDSVHSLGRNHSQSVAVCYLKIFEIQGSALSGPKLARHRGFSDFAAFLSLWSAGMEYIDYVCILPLQEGCMPPLRT